MDGKVNYFLSSLMVNPTIIGKISSVAVIGSDNTSTVISGTAVRCRPSQESGLSKATMVRGPLQLCGMGMGVWEG